MVVAAMEVTTVMQGHWGRRCRACQSVTTVLGGKGLGARGVNSWRLLI